MYQLPKFSHNTSFSRIAILTSGGDSPGMNPAIRALVRTAHSFDIEVIGIHRGYSGLLNEEFEPLNSKSVSGLCHRGGTYLKSARCLEFHEPTTRQHAADILSKHGIEALIVIGGDGSLTGAHALYQEFSIPVIGLPGTIDNDIYGTDDSIGFDTAVTTAVDGIDKISDTAHSHDRHFLVEVMGRNYGLLACHVAIAAGAEMVIVPEHKTDITDISQQLSQRRKEGIGSSGIIVVAESGREGWSYQLSEEMKQLGEDPRVCVLGHLQRGGKPTAHDRLLAATLGNCAVHALLEGQTDVMVGVTHGVVSTTPLKSVISQKKGLPIELMDLINELQH
jgi:6-phosphofructokinase 1